MNEDKLICKNCGSDEVYDVEFTGINYNHTLVCAKYYCDNCEDFTELVSEKEYIEQ